MKLPIAVLMTDTHADEDNLELIDNIFQQAIQLSNDVGVRYIFHAGDFFKSRSKQSIECLLGMKETFSRFSKNDKIMFCIHGNHDKRDQNSAKGYMNLYKDRNVKLFEKFGVEIIGNVMFCMISFFPEGESFLDVYTELLTHIQDNYQQRVDKEKLIKVLICHASINGVRNNDGTTVEGDVEVDFFEYFDRVFVGHYHDRQKINNKIIYVGSTHQANYGEDEYKGFTVIYSDGSYKFHNAKFPLFIHEKIHVDDREEIQNFIKEHIGSNNNIRLTLVGSKEQVDSIQKSIKAESIDVRYESIEDSLINSVEDLNISTNITKTGLMNHWINYCKLNSVDNDLKIIGMKKFKNLI